jgi:UDP-N-acetylglucosamine--N-acetylmuramyl-(pentapeptide) pyrophosphoryl-undecaprenol N-acetylglucosamine transferase
LVFVGRLYSRTNSKQKAKEKEEIEKRHIPFIAYESGKVITTNIIALIPNIVLLIKGFIHAVSIIVSKRPTVYVSFGSYLSIPMALAAWLCRVPIVLHEQTRTAGIANTFVARFAHAVAISHQESKSFFPPSKTHFTGNLLRKTVLTPSTQKPSWLTTKATKPILYITGGSQGSEIINSTVGRVVKQLTKNWIIIHQCGGTTLQRNYKRELEKSRSKISSQLRTNYIVREWISETELSWIYAHARIAISRAGANTVLELQVKKLPSILIPLPFSHNNEQFLNAKALADHEQAVLLPQKNLTPQTLLATISEINNKYEKIKENLEKMPSNPSDADKKLFTIITQVSS